MQSEAQEQILQQDLEDPQQLVRELAAALRYARYNGAEQVDRAWSDYKPPAAESAPQRSPTQAPRALPVAPNAPVHTPAPTGLQIRADVRPLSRMPPPPAQPVLLAQPTASVGAARPSPQPLDVAAELLKLRDRIGDCRRCPHAVGRQHIVFGTGDSRARLMIVGVAPSLQDDAAGQPWQGESGQLLDKMLAAMGQSRQSTWQTWLTLCRVPDGQTPQPDAIASCTPFLRTQLSLVKPQVLLIFGESAARFLMARRDPEQPWQGHWGQVLGVPTLATWSPQAMLGDSSLKKQAWADLQSVMAKLAADR